MVDDQYLLVDDDGVVIDVGPDDSDNLDDYYDDEDDGDNWDDGDD